MNDASSESKWRPLWGLDPELALLNHGSFGACPLVVLDAQSRMRARMERCPDHFFIRELEGLLDNVRQRVAEFVKCDAADLCLIPNATYGVNSVLRSLSLEPGDELLTTDHAYNACRNALEYVAGRQRTRVVYAAIPFTAGDDEIVQRIIERVTARTRLALIDHVTSASATIFPVAKIVAALQDRGVDVLVDGAHAPGMVELDIAALQPAYYTANCHKWLCAPKGSALLYVRPDRQERLRPLAISHGYNMQRPRPRLWLEFDWTGTFDPSAVLCIPDSLDYLGGLLPGGWPAFRAHNHRQVLAGREILVNRLGPTPSCPAAQIGSMITLPLPGDTAAVPPLLAAEDPLQRRLFERHGVDVMITALPGRPGRCVRISAMLYNGDRDYQRLAEALQAEGVA